jgi:hypothetical protein
LFPLLSKVQTLYFLKRFLISGALFGGRNSISSPGIFGREHAAERCPKSVLHAIRSIGSSAQGSIEDAPAWPYCTLGNHCLPLMRNVKRVKKLAPRRLCAGAITSTYG